ncbi:MAG: serine hydrolase [Oscillospiraceae bacterium]|nr:serine hydrolase [Oscillospiraceae bacterium]
MNTKKYVEKLMKDYNVAGMSIAVVKDGKVITAEGFGLRDVESGLPMTENTVLPIGSTTKSFTALALSMLVDEGKLSWDEPVKTYIPWLKLSDPYLTEHVTTRDLLCHRTGIPRYDMQTAFGTMDDWQRQIQSFQYLQTNQSFRTKLQYSNQMVALAGHLIDVLTDSTYEQFIKERIFKPLGMSHSDFEVDSLRSYEDYSKGYVFTGEGYMEPPYLHLGAFNPAGGIVSNALDMAAYMLFQLGDGTWNGQRLVSEENLKEMHTHQMIGSPYFWEFEEVSCAEYGFGWMTDIYRGIKMLSHGGNTNGFSSQLAIVPAQQFGIVALSNATSSFSVEALSNYLIDEDIGIKEIPDWSTRYQEIFGKMMGEAMAEIQKRAEAKTPNTVPTKPVETYAGIYEHPGFGTITLTVKDSALAGEWNGNAAMFNHYQYDEFDMILPAMGAQLPAEFIFDDSGAIEGIRVSLEAAPGIKPDLFTKKG